MSHTGDPFGIDSLTVAFHEAGHAIAALSQGVRVAACLIKTEETRAAFVTHGFDRFGGITSYVDLNWAFEKPQTTAHARVRLAGPVAEVIAISKGLISQRENLWSDVTRHGATVADVRSASRDAMQILNRDWPALHALAYALNARSALDEFQILHIVGPVMSDQLRQAYANGAQ